MKIKQEEHARAHSLSENLEILEKKNHTKFKYEKMSKAEIFFVLNCNN